MATVALLIAFIGGFALGIKIGLLFTVGLSMGYAYSARPFGWKARPIAGFLANAVAHGILMFMVGYLVGGGEPWTGLLYSTPYFFAVGAAFIGTTIPDYEGDRKTGKITPAVSLGPKSASAFMAICADSAVIAAFLVDDMPMFLAASISLPFYHYYWQKGKYGGNPIVAVKISILALTLAAAWRFWPYLAGFMLLILVTRIYYLKRFHIIYPKLT
jgi:4-hydroxybenzoate polyprenyltransferase